MRKKFFLMIMVGAAMVSCKKEKSTVQIKVIDQVANTSMSNARVTVYKCGHLK